MRLDAKTLATLTLPPGKREAKYFDERLPGHGVRLRHPTDQSRWRWITQTDVAGVTQIITNGAVSLLSPGQAFNRSRDLWRRSVWARTRRKQSGSAADRPVRLSVAQSLSATSSVGSTIAVKTPSSRSSVAWSSWRAHCTRCR